MPKTKRSIFKQGSTTFFLSSLFFPKAVKQDVFDLYSFVRIADDYVDQIPADTVGFYRLRNLWESGAGNTNGTTDEQVVANMQRVSTKHDFDPAWTTAFLDVMQSDIQPTPKQTLPDTLAYVYGSAEVIGLMMSRIMGLSKEAQSAAQMQGRAFQMINFIRDINEDIELGRQYFPQEDLKRFNLADVALQTTLAQADDFEAFLEFQLDRYEAWQQEAEQGYDYIPRRLRIPLQTASDMYAWTAQEIRKNPYIIYEKKVKPSKVRVIGRALTNTL